MLTGILLFLGAYVAVGCANAAGGPLMLWDGHHGLDGWVELGFYLLLWPLQLLVQTLVWIHHGIEWVLERTLP